MNTRKWLAECHAWLDDPTSVQWEECERLTAENAQLQKDYTRIKESATLWHDHYKTKCQEYMDHQAILGAEIVALEAERDALAESDKRLREEVGNLTRGIDHYRQQWSDVCAENQDLRNDIYEHHSADCKKFLLVKKAEREALRADRDSWRQQCSDRVADAARFIDERDAWEKNCDDQIDLLNFTANERDAAESACQILALEVGELQTDVKKLGKWSDEVHAENMALRADAQRYQWLASDDRTQVDWDRMLIAFLSGRLAAEIDAAIAGEKK